MVEQCVIQSRQGLPLAAVVNVPTGTNEKKCPLVIMLHGNTGWKEEEHLETLAKELSASGFYTVRFDAPGSGKSGGTWEHDYRVTNYLNAVDDIYDHMLKSYSIDDSTVGLWGHSMGGMIAVYSAAQHVDRYSAICGSQLSGGAMSKAQRTFTGTESEGLELATEIFGTIWLPKEYFQDRSNYLTLNVVDQLTIPQLYIAGTQDDLVPAETVRAIYEAAREPKEYLEFDTGHFYKRDPEARQQINDAAISFFIKHLL